MCLKGSLSSHAPSLIEGIDPPHIESGYVHHSSKVRSPEDDGFGFGFGFQLPSPLEDEAMLDTAMVDREVTFSGLNPSPKMLIEPQRRREQNRVAQRAFRERKESKLKQLEKRISDLKAEHRDLRKKYNNLRTAHLRLQSGLRTLLDASETYDGDDTNTDGSAPNERDP